tara:strand:+ start:2573 stop:3118 length:546 start_codon:yes stop_codon:yes gene_type:complete
VLADADKPADEGVPDSYTFELPDGLELGADEVAKLDGFKEKAKEYGLTQAQFQNLLTYDIERTQAAVDDATNSWTQRVDGWKQSAKTDTEFGGQNYAANVKTAQAAITQFGDAEFSALLKSPSEDNPEGLAVGNHPAVLRFLNRIGKAIGDPSLIIGDGAMKDSSDAAKLKRMYPTMFTEK